MRIVCQQTILMKYHALFVISEKAAKLERTCNGFVLQMAHFYSKKSIVKKSLQNITK